MKTHAVARVYISFYSNNTLSLYLVRCWHTKKHNLRKNTTQFHSVTPKLW